MHKLDGNRTLAHSGGNALDRTVRHVAGYLLAGLAHLIVRTDVAAHHSNVTAVGRRVFWASIFRVPAHSSQRMLPCLPLFAVHTGAWPVARFGARAFREFLVCRVAEDAARCTVAASMPNKFRFEKFRNFFSNTARDLYGGEAAPVETWPPLSKCPKEHSVPCAYPRYEGMNPDCRIKY